MENCFTPQLYLCLALPHCIAQPLARIVSLRRSSRGGSASGQLGCPLAGARAGVLLEAVLFMSLCQCSALPAEIVLADREQRSVIPDALSHVVSL